MKRRVRKVGGELAIIVIGVLIALGFDSWYQDLSDARLAASYVERLVSDLEADSATFEFVLRGLDQKDAALLHVAQVSVGLVPPDSGLFESVSVSQAFGFSTPGTRRSTYDEMIATGSLRLILDSDLRARVVAYYGVAVGQLDRIERRRTDYPDASYRYNASRWGDPGLEGSYPGMADLAFDSIRTARFQTLVNAERIFSSFQRSVVAELLASATEVLAAVRAARDSAQDQL